jgi:hypothetical protein
MGVLSDFPKGVACVAADIQKVYRSHRQQRYVERIEM